jgi:hypothetical protein
VPAARRWLASAAFQRLVAALGGPAPVAGNLGDLVRWSASVLDTRRGAERRDSALTTWTAEQVQALLSAAGPLGLLETTEPGRSSYGVTLLLGGATTGNRLRTRLARDLLSAGVDLGMIVAVTAERPLSTREHATDPESVKDPTEWSNLLRYLDGAFGPLRTGATVTGCAGNGFWQDQEYRTAAGRNLRVLVAPSSSTHRRANTSDGLAFLLERIPAQQRNHVLIITSSIYAPYQFFVGVPIVSSDGAERVELVGTPTSTGGDTNLLAQRIAQEIHAAVNAVTTLLHGSPGH